MNVKPLKDQVYDYLHQQMVSGELLPGSIINLDAIAKKLGISKTPLRDALIFCEAEGFVEIQPRRGVMVTQLNPDTIREIYQILGALESSALEASARRFHPSHLEKMRAVHEELGEIRAQGDFERYFALNQDLHSCFTGMAGNATMEKLLLNYNRRLFVYPMRVSVSKEWMESSQEEHGQILELLEAGKSKQAADFLRDVHWSYAAQARYIKQYYNF